MSQELSSLTNAIRDAHERADEITEEIRELGSQPSDWRVGLTDTEPEVLYEAESGEDDAVIIHELGDGASALYILRELASRGCTIDTEIAVEDDLRILYLYRANLKE